MAASPLGSEATAIPSCAARDPLAGLGGLQERFSPSGEKGVELLSPFPLPSLTSSFFARRDWGCRSTRARRERRIIRDSNAVIDALNWLHFRGSAGSPRSPELSVEVHARIVAAVKATLTLDAIPSPREAFRSLLNGRSIYESELAGRSIGHLQHVRQISLPESARLSALGRCSATRCTPLPGR